MSHGRRLAGTVSAGSARLAGNANARAVPYPITRRKIGSVDVGLVPAYAASASTKTASSTMPVAAIRRRSNRSASGPVTNTSNADGANSASPSRPSASSLPVRSKTCLPSTIVSAAIAVDELTTEVRSAMTDRRWRGSTSGT